MPLSNFWGATLDRSVTGQITVTLEGVTVTVPWVSTKASKSDILAAAVFTTKYVIDKGVSNQTLWDYRHLYAYYTWKALDYADKIATLPQNQRAPWTAKQNRCITERDRYKALAGE